MLTPDFIEVKKNQSLAERYGYSLEDVKTFLKGKAVTKEVKNETPVDNVAQTTDNLDDLFG